MPIFSHSLACIVVVQSGLRLEAGLVRFSWDGLGPALGLQGLGRLGLVLKGSVLGLGTFKSSS